ncbi:phage major capsid protein [Bradyrhizobium prioriisuperbiae]|uniref:phage major capsid protein n=1 Tax=Bradyrhizobium prioriisuperbiae TaxID=2854389 RepID=UPI0028E1A6E0|nr:phage major capsid protein [Bradyrhizobium prioritasuperba]
MKRNYYAGALALVAILVVGAILFSGLAPHDIGHGLTMAMAGTAAVSAEDIGAITKQLSKIEVDMKSAADDVKKNGETLQTEMKNLGNATSETKLKVDEALAKHGELAQKHTETASRLTEIEQALAAKREKNDIVEAKSLGQMFVESAAFQKFDGKGNVRVSMDRADITNVTGTVGNNTSPANSLVSSMRVPGIITPAERPMTIRDLIAPGQTSQGVIEYVQETGFTNSAAVVTEGQSKPYSDLTFELKNAPVRTIAHLFKASRQILDDAPALRSYIDARARYGLNYAEEAELLNGDGTGAHIKGLVPYATPFNAAFVPTAQTKIDVIRLAILQVMLAEWPATGIVLHPTDWAGIQLTKDSQNRYIIGNPQDGNAPRLWNLPVVETQSETVDNFLVGAFKMAAQIFDRMEIEILLSTENSVDFEKNMVTLRAEERLALAVYRPEALVTGAFSTAT